MMPDDNAIVTTPASRPRRPTVAVFGAGIAGLTAAHELAERGFKVTEYEAAADPRRIDRDDEGKREGNDVPPVRLGGMAATQFLRGHELHRFLHKERIDAERRGAAEPAAILIRPTGDHGFRFFPAYYLHIWDTLRRIPLYEKTGPNYVVTARTVYDNVRRVIAQAGTAPDGKPSLLISREAPRSVAELIGSYHQMTQLGYTANDLSTFFGRIARYLATSPQRRQAELECVSIYDYVVGKDATSHTERFQYSPPFKQQLSNMPRVLAAFDARHGDARTGLTTYVQLNMALDRYDSKADGVLNGPTTEAWFDPWYTHLTKLGVAFVPAALKRFVLNRLDLNATLRAVITDGDRLAAHAHIPLSGPGDPDGEITAFMDREGPDERYVDADYFVVATDAFRAELATADLRGRLRNDREAGKLFHRGKARQRLRNLSTVVGLAGYATTRPPEGGPLQGNPHEQRNPLMVNELGVQPWDRFRTISGIQFYFDTEFQVLQGHVYYSNSDWALSSINQTGLWREKPRLEREHYVSIMSVDIGDWRKRSSYIHKRAIECRPYELAEEVWRQVSKELSASTEERDRYPQLPLPTWYSIDKFLEYDEHGKPIRNAAPYLIPIVGDWNNRPGAYPWNPSGSSPTWLPRKKARSEQETLRVWQPRHGGYQVHFDKLVFAGTWCKTFTRMTSMEGACESGRHAVNAILDHYLYWTSDKKDERKEPPPSWRLPFGFVDQDLTSPIRFPTPAGDYCFIFDCENREPADARPTRELDAAYFAEGLPHPWALYGIDHASVAASNMGSYGSASTGYDPLWIIEQLRQWRHLVETVYAPGCAPRSPQQPRPKENDPSMSGLFSKNPKGPAGDEGKPM